MLHGSNFNLCMLFFLFGLLNLVVLKLFGVSFWSNIEGEVEETLSNIWFSCWSKPSILCIFVKEKPRLLTQNCIRPLSSFGFPNYKFLTLCFSLFKLVSWLMSQRSSNSSSRTLTPEYNFESSSNIGIQNSIKFESCSKKYLYNLSLSSNTC